ncbi:uncharacterized protein MELLADRAFT_108936 [Melampsora larici-populina 98AG31]|uniref:Uncharacterized protein n=1 Tax=Melampsora larici-populina (strain 98AG31 / pathotype 3-4-7) TaxID=747676 RepID=F4RUT2_MELLP|nr:uncharacterized protein MELLADRAFT_108936 [Melampsora larici-populina 98AG31]EGG03870.1 hypothetical protein MELLADRAFT_108936 [Melampsora larici-populina 98AG31]
MAPLQPFKLAQDIFHAQEHYFLHDGMEIKFVRSHQVPQGSVGHGVTETRPKSKNTRHQSFGLADDGSRVRSVETLLEFSDVLDCVLPKDQTHLSLTQAPERSMLDRLFEELNSISELSISFGSSRTLDLKIFPLYGNPPRVDDWDVPIDTFSSVMWSAIDDIDILGPRCSGLASTSECAQRATLETSLASLGVSHGDPPGRSTAVREPPWLSAMKRLDTDEWLLPSNSLRPSKSRRARRSRTATSEHATTSLEAIDFPLHLPLKLDGRAS